MLSSQVKLSADRQTDKLIRQTDRRTPVKQYAPDLSMWGHKNHSGDLSSLNNETLR